MYLQEYLSGKNKNHLIFDFDETLARIEIDWSEWHEGVFEIYKKFDPNWKFEGHGGGFRMDFYINEFTKRFGEEIHSELDRFNREYEQAKKTGYTPNPELIEFVKNDEQYAKYLYTSNAGVTIHPLLEEIGIKEKFVRTVTRDEVVLIKPDPEGMSLIIGQDVPIDQYMMIGDSRSDEGAAKAVGMDFFKVEFFAKDQ